MTWICDICYSEMQVKRVKRNRNRVYCPCCGSEWFVDDDDEYINEGDNYDYDDDEDEDGDEDESERLSVYDAVWIWLSKGKDEDYMFGYSEEELENAL